MSSMQIKIESDPSIIPTMLNSSGVMKVPIKTPPEMRRSKIGSKWFLILLTAKCIAAKKKIE